MQDFLTETEEEIGTTPLVDIKVHSSTIVIYEKVKIKKKNKNIKKFYNVVP